MGRHVSIIVVLLGGPLLAAPPARPVPKAHASYVETIPGTTITFEMIAVPGGTFWQGSPIDEPGRRDNEGPRHRVELRPFWIAKCEVTWEQFDAYLNPPGRWDRSGRRLPRSPRQLLADAVTRPSERIRYVSDGWMEGDYPASGMGHHAAMKYCEWLSIVTGHTYRLPTEAEWEYAARVGTNTRYFFGNDPKKLDEYAWHRGNSATEFQPKGAPHRVGTKRPNPWGLHDMYGNVLEWCLDEYDPDFYDSFVGLPLGPVNRPGTNPHPHVLRGGHCRSGAEGLRSAARFATQRRWWEHDIHVPRGLWWQNSGGMVGFRIVRPVEEYPALRGLKSEVIEFPADPVPIGKVARP